MSKENHTTESRYLKGKLLIAMPSLEDTRFHRAVILMCSHDIQGAMGLVINHTVPGMTFEKLTDQLEFPDDLTLDPKALEIPIMHGGPVDGGRGFILHDAAFRMKDTIDVNEHLAVTATLPVLQDVASGKGPERLLFILGYAGWTAGQLEEELKGNAWLVADASADLLFETPAAEQWTKAVTQLGIDPAMLSGAAGSA